MPRRDRCSSQESRRIDGLVRGPCLTAARLGALGPQLRLGSDDRGQAGFERFDHVVGRFHSHRQANRTVIEPQAEPIVRTHSAMAGAGRMAERRTNLAQRWGERNSVDHGRDKSVDTRTAAAEVKIADFGPCSPSRVLSLSVAILFAYGQMRFLIASELLLAYLEARGHPVLVTPFWACTLP